MKRYIVTIFLLIIFTQMQAQIYEIDSVKIDRFRIEAGLFVPVGNLSNKMDVSKEIGVYYRIKAAHKDIVDVGFKGYFPEGSKEFTYYGRDSIYATRSKSFGFIALTKINKHYNFSLFKKEIIVEWTSGIGFNFLFFEDKESPENTSGTRINEDGNSETIIDTNSKALMSPFLSQSFGFTRKRIGFSVQYDFMPYNWFTKRIESSFGNSAFSLFVSCKI
jgi:hypothetical protein